MPVTAIPAQGGLVVTGANLDRMAQAAQPWTTYTPTVTNVTTSAAAGRYHRHGDKVTVEFQVTLSAAPTATVTLSLPVTASTALGTGLVVARGTVTGLRQGVGYKTGNIYLASSTTVAFLSDGGVGGWANGVPVAWANTDSWAGHFEYEAA